MKSFKLRLKKKNDVIYDFKVLNTLKLKMDVPGLSLFQGAESIQLNDDQPRIEEEQAEIDRLRRNEEVSLGQFRA